MHGFSPLDGFVEITENLAEMIKYLGNEPSVGLFYIQQHTQNAVPNLVSIKNNVVAKSHETSLHTEDLEDSISMLSSMKECGFPIADDMIKDIRKSLAVMSSSQPKKGFVHKRAFSFQMRSTGSWSPDAWGRGSTPTHPDGERKTNYFTNVFKSAKQKASNFKWPQLDPKDTSLAQGGKLLSYPTPPISVAPVSTSSSRADMESDELPLSGQVADDHDEKEAEGKEVKADDVNISPKNLLSLSESYYDFKADKEAKLEEWLGGAECNSDIFKKATDV
ncbi:BLOC-1-related complex subunit 8 homolog [Mangifera indica]|uniref:BLOC-1-related complex subunit 8 homolog n=1 Tax=Mangifera indica TaxID=29780 RepID=UPI001CF9B892|nr:BLOC-1-related complex subunit 8 homolog [Mangifera indica]XP_044461157.1 BLOC-1-related complex subunit 8 homolog [Mangifera indica]XP_044461158.1 BLOC-1-related complex subunit 8 homolog [Mangifera indica]